MKEANKKPWTARRIHLWVAVILALPFMVMAISGILISMRSVTQIQVPMAWLGAESVPERLPFMAYMESSDGNVWIGNAKGLTRVGQGQTEVIEAFAGQEVVGLAQVADQSWPVVATRMALWVRQDDGQWNAVKRGHRLYTGVVGDLINGRGVIDAVVSGRADVGTLDSYYLDLLRQHEPAYAAQVRVVDSTRAHPIPPLVATAALSEAQTSQLRGALIDTATEPALAPLMQRLMLKGFSVVESQDYDHLADMARAQTEPFDRL